MCLCCRCSVIVPSDLDPEFVWLKRTGNDWSNPSCYWWRWRCWRMDALHGGKFKVSTRSAWQVEADLGQPFVNTVHSTRAFGLK